MLKVHELARGSAVPSEATEIMAASIRQHGLLYPIVMYEGRILDGKIRYHGGVKARYTFRGEDFTTFAGTREQAIALVREQFFVRRYIRLPKDDLEHALERVGRILSAAADAPPQPPTPAALPPMGARGLLDAADNLRAQLDRYLAAQIERDDPQARARILSVLGAVEAIPALLRTDVWSYLHRK